VTGATYGIAAATAVALARDGFDVAVAELRPTASPRPAIFPDP
jgi:NAD(P)-dependent dehydrogenase (short-subunit alcohol dehydrogenase family)